jgi:uncharacterized protein YajQ (UPF0234 family)
MREVASILVFVCRIQKEECEEAVEERERLAARCQLLELEADCALTLRHEVDLLTQDNRTLEEQLEGLRQGRRQVAY